MTQPDPAQRALDIAEPRRVGFSWFAQLVAIIRKDLLIETKSGEVVTTSTFFALLVVVLASFSLHSDPKVDRLVAPGVIWMSVAFAAVLALARSWQRERQESALDGLLVAPVQKSAVFAGKALVITLFLGLVELVVITTAALLLALDLSRYGAGLGLIALFATPGIAAAGTLFGSMTVRTQARDLILATVLFPLLAPSLLTAVAATRELLGGATASELGAYLMILGVFDIVFTTGGLALFGTLIER